MHPISASVLENLQKHDASTLHDDQAWTASTVKKYMLLDSRRGLTELARRFVRGTDMGECEILYQDYWGKVREHTITHADRQSLNLNFRSLSFNSIFRILDLLHLIARWPSVRSRSLNSLMECHASEWLPKCGSQGQSGWWAGSPGH
jgi:hypothetical protein